MSYEGFEQNICENGHLFETDADGYTPICNVCQTSIVVWSNSVDDTNCDAVGIIEDFSSLLVEAEESQTCNLGHVHITKHATYRVPTKAEAAKLRCYGNCLNKS